MKVWLLMHGDQCDASTVFGVFATWELAEADAVELMHDRLLGHDAGDWHLDPTSSTECACWRAGIADFLVVEAFEVETASSKEPSE